MACTLDLYPDYLISSNSQSSATGLSRLLAGAVSHDQITLRFSTSCLDPAVRTQAKPLVRQAEYQRPSDAFAVLIADDFILKKAHTNPNALIRAHWDHSLGRLVKGVNFVRLLYQVGELVLSVAVELIEKTKAKSTFTKNGYLRQMLMVAQQQVGHRYLLADSWYASAGNMNAVLKRGHDFVLALESSRTVALSVAARVQGRFQSLDTLAFSDEPPLCA